MKQPTGRGEIWLQQLSAGAARLPGLCPSVQVADGHVNGEAVRFIAVVPDADNHYPRARQGEVGLLEGWTLAKVVSETVAQDAKKADKRPIIAVIDVASQAYGRREEASPGNDGETGSQRTAKNTRGASSHDYWGATLSDAYQVP